MVYYLIDENGNITQSAAWKFDKNCKASDKEIVRGCDSKLYFAGEEPTPPPPSYNELRLAEYPPIADVVDAICKKLDGDSTEYNALQAKRLSVKKKYPKE